MTMTMMTMMMMMNDSQQRASKQAGIVRRNEGETKREAKVDQLNSINKKKGGKWIKKNNNYCVA